AKPHVPLGPGAALRAHRAHSRRQGTVAGDHARGAARALRAPVHDERPRGRRRVTSELEHAIALVAYGNAVLAGDRAARRGLTLEHPGFEAVISMAFMRGGERVATRPIAWLDSLRRRGARRLALTMLAHRTDWLPDHEPVAFAGGSGVMIAADTRPA